MASSLTNFGLMLGADGDLQTAPLKNITDPVVSIAQRVRVRLQFFLSEWFLDLTAGVPYFQQILVKNPDPKNVQGLIRAEILKTPGVLSLLALNVTFDRAIRKLTVTFTSNTDAGQLTQTLVLG